MLFVLRYRKEGKKRKGKGKVLSLQFSFFFYGEVARALLHHFRTRSLEELEEGEEDMEGELGRGGVTLLLGKGLFLALLVRFRLGSILGEGAGSISISVELDTGDEKGEDMVEEFKREGILLRNPLFFSFRFRFGWGEGLWLEKGDELLELSSDSPLAEEGSGDDSRAVERIWLRFCRRRIEGGGGRVRLLFFRVSGIKSSITSGFRFGFGFGRERRGGEGKWGLVLAEDEEVETRSM